MRDFTSKTIKTIKPSGIRKFFDIAKQIEGCVSLGVGEPDFDTPWHITEEGIYALEKGYTFYTANQGMPDLRKEIVAWLARKYGVHYSQDEVIVTVGGSEAVDVSLRTCIDPGDEVLVPDPGYVCYAPDVMLAGGVVKTIKLKAENAFRLTPEQLEEAIGEKTKILLMNYPNNPTGAIMERADLEAIAKVIIKHDLLVITDEIYSELTYGQEHVCIAEIEGMRERTIVINGFSKAYSMTGWRLGYIAAPKEIIDQAKKIHQFAIMSAPTISQIAGIEALRNGDKDIVSMRDEYNRRRQYLYRALGELGMPCFEPKGAFYIFPSIERFHMSSEDFCLDLLEKEKLVVVPGTAFGESGEGFIRISYAYSLDALKEAIKRLRRYIARSEKEAVNS